MPKRGRPSKHTPEIADEIVDRLAGGESLRDICDDDTRPELPAPSTVVGWYLEDREGFSERYTRAMTVRAWQQFERLEDVSSGAHRDEDTSVTVQRDRLHADNLKWAMAKMLPTRFGDKVELEHSGRVDTGVLRVPGQVSEAEWGEMAHRMKALAKNGTNGSNGNGS